MTISDSTWLILTIYDFWKGNSWLENIALLESHYGFSEGALRIYFVPRRSRPLPQKGTRASASLDQIYNDTRAIIILPRMQMAEEKYHAHTDLVANFKWVVLGTFVLNFLKSPGGMTCFRFSIFSPIPIRFSRSMRGFPTLRAQTVSIHLWGAACAHRN